MPTSKKHSQFSFPRIFTITLSLVWRKIATVASEIDGEGLRTDVGAFVAPLDTDNTATVGNLSQGSSPMADEHQKQSSDTDGGQEAGQLEDDAEVDAEGDAGMIDGEMEAEVDLDPIG